MEGYKLDRVINDLEKLVNTISPFQTKWKPVWDHIRVIGAYFKDVQYPNQKARENSWTRFQSLVKKVKEIQAKEQSQYQDRARASKGHKDEILHCASLAIPRSNAILHIATLGASVLIKSVINKLPGPPIDEERNILQGCSENLAQGWELLSRYKGEMLGRDKDEAFEALRAAQARLGDAWETWKSGKQVTNEGRQHAREEQAAKHVAWQKRGEANIENLEQRLGKLTAVLRHKELYLDDLRDKRDSAWSDDFRDRVEGKIDKEEEKIQDLQDKIKQVEGWLEEARSKLR